MSLPRPRNFSRYHLNGRSGTRSSGHSARAAGAYIQRTAEYGRDRERAVAIRTLLSYRHRIKGREFIKRVSELGAARAVPVRVEAKRGKGSHITLYYGPRKTIVKDLRKEIAPGLLSAMIRQLGLARRDFR